MPEVAPALGIAPVPTVGARMSGSLAGDRATARHAPPRSPPKPPPASPPAPAARPGVEVARAGLLLEALVRPRAAGADGSVGPAALRGIARVLPVVATSGSGTLTASAPAAADPWIEGERLAKVLGPVGTDGILADADGLVILLRGARLHLPPGARLRIAWERPPSAVEPRPAEAVGPAAAPQTAPADAEALSGERPIRSAEPGPGPRAEPRGPPAPLEGALLAGPRPVAQPVAHLVEEAIRGLGGLFGLAIEPVAEEDARDRRDGRDRAAREPESGRSVFLLEFPELGRVRLTLVWSREGVELAVAGLPRLPGNERAAFLKAFEAGLAASGARGRAVFVTAPAGRPVAETAADPHRDGPEEPRAGPETAGKGP